MIRHLISEGQSTVRENNGGTTLAWVIREDFLKDVPLNSPDGYGSSHFEKVFQVERTAKLKQGLGTNTDQRELRLTELKNQKSYLQVPRNQFIQPRLKYPKPLNLLDLEIQAQRQK